MTPGDTLPSLETWHKHKHFCGIHYQGTKGLWEVCVCLQELCLEPQNCRKEQSQKLLLLLGQYLAILPQGMKAGCEEVVWRCVPRQWPWPKSFTLPTAHHYEPTASPPTPLAGSQRMRSSRVEHFTMIIFDAASSISTYLGKVPSHLHLCQFPASQ